MQYRNTSSGIIPPKKHLPLTCMLPCCFIHFIPLAVMLVGSQVCGKCGNSPSTDDSNRTDYRYSDRSVQSACCNIGNASSLFYNASSVPANHRYSIRSAQSACCNIGNASHLLTPLLFRPIAQFHLD